MNRARVSFKFKFLLTTPYKPRNPGGTPIYFLYRDVPTVRVSFSGSSVLSRVYNFTFSRLKQGRPRIPLLFSPFDHIIFADFMRLHWNAWKRKLMYRFWCFEYGLLGPVLKRVRNYNTFSWTRYQNLHLLCLEQGRGFVESAEPPYPNSCWVQPPGPELSDCLAPRGAGPYVCKRDHFHSIWGPSGRPTHTSLVQSQLRSHTHPGKAAHTWTGIPACICLPWCSRSVEQGKHRIFWLPPEKGDTFNQSQLPEYNPNLKFHKLSSDEESRHLAIFCTWGWL